MDDIIPIAQDEKDEKYIAFKEEAERKVAETYSVPSLRRHNSHVLKWIVHKLMKNIRSKRGRSNWK